MTALHRDVVAVGASAGGVEALRALVAGLPPDYPGAVLVVLHVPRGSPSALPAILSRSGPLPAGTAVDGEDLRSGRVYVAPNDHHLLLLDGRIRLTRGPAENGHRPAADPLFRSAARTYGPGVVGVVLSGTRVDGAAGLAAIAAHGGMTVVQDPADAQRSGMPQAAMEHMTPDHVLPAAKIGGLLAGLAVQPVSRFRCRVGHIWSPENPLDEQTITLEGALWMALRALEEKSALSRRMADTRFNRRSPTAHRFRGIAEDAETAGAMLRQLVTDLGATPEGTRDAATPPGRPGGLPDQG